MEIISRRFRAERRSSLKLGRSNSSTLASEILSSEISRIGAGYERLSESMRITDSEERGGDCYRRRRNRAWAILTKVFSSVGKTGGGDVIFGRRVAVEGLPKTAAEVEVEEKKKKNKRRSPWMPDPYRRWPVQGW